VTKGACFLRQCLAIRGQVGKHEATKLNSNLLTVPILPIKITENQADLSLHAAKSFHA
jgi:hypothetical protein